MILIVCMPCALAIRVLPRALPGGGMQDLEGLIGRRSDFWPDKFSCPKCHGSARGLLETDADPRVLQLMELRDLTPNEAFAAINGLGFPEEQKCSLETVEELLKEKPVRRIIGSNVRGMERVVIEALELWDGTTIFLGSAPEGAVAYRIRRPVSYVKQLEAQNGNRPT